MKIESLIFMKKIEINDENGVLITKRDCVDEDDCIYDQNDNVILNCCMDNLCNRSSIIFISNKYFKILIINISILLIFL